MQLIAMGIYLALGDSISIDDYTGVRAAPMTSPQMRAARHPVRTGCARAATLKTLPVRR